MLPFYLQSPRAGQPLRVLFIRGLRALALLLVLWPWAAQAHKPATGHPVPAAPALASALAPDGTLRPGFQGSFDPKGYALYTAPNGRPAFRPASAKRTTGAGDERWQSGFGLPGTNGQVEAMVVAPNGDVYIGGRFTVAGAAAAKNVAKWNGTAWSALGAGINGEVMALALIGNDLYAGGFYSQAGGTAINSLARWNGIGWSAVGGGVDNSVNALAVVGTDLYVGGTMSVAGGVAVVDVAKWNGTAWSALGAGLSGSVQALAVLGTDVYATGTFTKSGAVTVNYVARWNGTAWSALGTGLNNMGTELAVVGSTLYVGGQFTQAGGAAIPYLAQWNGTAWSAVGAGVNNIVTALSTVGTDLYVAGSFTQAGGAAIGYAAKWSGTAWSSLNTGFTNSSFVYCFAPAGSSVYIGGTFSYIGTTSAPNVARLTGTTWSAIGPGLNGQVGALAVSGTDVYVGGNFTAAGGAAANKIAKWDGTTWSALGAGVNGFVSAIVVSGTDVYVGGTFTQAGGGAANNVAKWNGTTWSTLGTGVNGSVEALAVLGTDVYVGGYFTQAGGAAISYVARWNGTAWSALGSGTVGGVQALAVSGTTLYVGGDFHTAGGLAADFVAKWTGSAWGTLGSGANGTVVGLAVSGTTLYMTGSFSAVSGVAAQGVAKWNGTAWSALGAGVANFTDALAVAGTDVYVGGSFTQAGGITTKNVAKWDGTAWSALGTGTDAPVFALAVRPNGQVAVGGNFLTVGDGSKVMAYFGNYGVTPTEPTLTSLTPATGAAGSTFALAGTNLTGTTAITFISGGVATAAPAGYTVASAGSITGATVPAGLAPGTYNVSVTTPNGTSNELIFTIPVPVPANDLCTAANLPVITCGSSIAGSTTAATRTGDPTGTCTETIDAAGGVFYRFTGTGGSVTLSLCSGTNYDSKLFVFTGTCGSYTCVKGDDDGCGALYSKVTCASVSGTSYLVYVAGYGTATGNFTLSATCVLPPTITSLTPPSGPVGTVVAVAGTNFTGATAVAFGGTAAGSFTVNSASSITATVPGSLAAGTYAVTVTTPTGTSNSLPFTVGAALSLTAVAPTPSGLGQAITLTGTGLGSPTALTINGADALGGIVSNSGTSLVVRVPGGAAVGSGSVSISTASGTAASAFAVMSAPGNALAFSGGAEYVAFGATPAATNLGPGGLTLEAWVYYDGSPDKQSIIRKTGDYGLLLVDGRLSAEVWPLGTGSPSWRVVDGSVTIGANRWTHLAATWNPATASFRLYVNGVPDAGATSITDNVPGSENLTLGNSILYPTNRLIGRLDEVRIYNTALPVASIQADMQSTAPAAPASQVLYMNFDQGTPATASTGANAGLTTLYDLANGYAGTLTNFALASGNTTSNYVQSYAMVVPTATRSANRSATGFAATWTAPVLGTVTSYLLDVATTADFAAPIAGSPFATTATSYALTGLNPSRAYYYRVRALNSALALPDQGAFSNVVGQATPLPVELSAFTATAQGTTAVRLAWTTASEKNSAAFEVERSVDGVAFARLGTVAAAGSSSAPRTYELLDTNPPTHQASLYYRLRQVDRDGTFSYSPVRTVALKGAAAGLFLFPNPAHGHAATLTGALPGTVVTVTDALGRPVVAAMADATGTAALALPAGLPTGVYVVRAGAQALRLTVE